MRFDRNKTKMFPLDVRDHKLVMENIKICPCSKAKDVSVFEESQIKVLAEKLEYAKANNKSRMITYGAHLIKNGLAPVINKLICNEYATHIATNGAGSIHDWEFAYMGKSTEDVRKNTAKGMFGTWDETGKYMNLAVLVGATNDLGYGESVGKMIDEDGLMIPSMEQLQSEITEEVNNGKFNDNTAAKVDLLNAIKEFNIPSGKLEIIHKYKDYSVQYTAYKKGIPFTVHPGIGYDIIYTHPMNNGGAIGRCALRDFLTFADSVSKLGNGGVHMTIGSAIMAPMVFEKSMSMSNNLSINLGNGPLKDFYLVVVDIADGGNWDWSNGEPPMDSPAYYLRFCKSFYRMGGTLDYICIDNREFLLKLCENLFEGK